MEKGKKLTRRQLKNCGFSSSPIDINDGDDIESVDGNAIVRWQRGKGRVSRLRFSNIEVNGEAIKVRSEDVEDDDPFLAPLTRTCVSSLATRKRVRIHGMVGENCDAVDSTSVPRKLRSGLKKRQNLPFCSKEIDFDSSCQSKEWDCLSKEEEEVAEALLSLSQSAPLCHPKKRKFTAASISYSEATVIEVMDDPVERTDNLVEVKQQQKGTAQHFNNMVPPRSTHENKKGFPPGNSQKLPYVVSARDYSGNGAPEQLKMKLDATPGYPPQKLETPQCPLLPVVPEVAVCEEQRTKHVNEKETVPLFQPSVPSTSHGLSLTSSPNNLAGCPNSASSMVSSNGNLFKVPPINSGTMKAWKKCAIHVYVSHLIQMHLNKEKACEPSAPANQPKPEEGSPNCISAAPNNNALKERNTRETRIQMLHSNERLLAAQGGNFVNTSAAHLASNSTNGLQLSAPIQVQYLHQAPQHAPVPFPFLQASYGQGNLASAPIQQAELQMPQLLYSQCYPSRGSLAGGSATMKLPHLQPQQLQMWQLHMAQYGATVGSASSMWQQNSRLHDLVSLHSPALLPSAMSPNMSNIEVFCGPYQSTNSQQQQHLRLM